MLSQTGEDGSETGNDPRLFNPRRDPEHDEYDDGYLEAFLKVEPAFFGLRSLSA